MKALRFLSVFTLYVVGLMLPARAESASAADRPPLQMQVQAPYVTDLVQQRAVVDALFGRIRDGVRAAHRKLEIKEVEGEPAKARRYWPSR